jgi:predicted lipid-binding transport protein (Tim44 family)
MKALLTFLVSVALLAGASAAIVLPTDAQAARVGGARSFGAQRAVPPRATPAPQQAPQQAKQAAPQQPAAQPATPPAGNRWLGPLAGIAAGLGLGWLLSQGGFGGALAGILMALLAGVAIFAVLRLVMRGRAPEAAARRPITEPAPFAAAGPQAAMAEALEPQLPRSSSGSPMPAPAVRGEAPRLESQIVLPAGFDADSFIRQAKLNFIRLQEANDQRDLDTLKEVTTEQMYDALVADLPAKGGAQHTDVVSLDASLLEVSTEGQRHWVSVRFHGSIREDQRAAAPFEEVWHLQKPVSGETGWLLAGIQQVS